MIKNNSEVQLTQNGEIKSIIFRDEELTLYILDQRLLPDRIVYLKVSGIEQIYDAIKTLAVRGAPAIGIAAAWGLAMSMQRIDEATDLHTFQVMLGENITYLNSSRPTAVNLSWALHRMESVVIKAIKQNESLTGLKKALLSEAKTIHDEDERTCKLIGEWGLSLLSPHMHLLTHCNAGSLATAKYGTALAPMYLGQERGYDFTVFVDETRPLLQGARLTAWELQRGGVNAKLICDNAAAATLAKHNIGAILVGADRVAANGDTANKVGTLNLAILAEYYKVPFYVLCPQSTLDPQCQTGNDIIIEERDASEVTQIAGKSIAPENVLVFNPAFDITPAELITAIITEEGILRYPYDIKIKGSE